jgi:hypothetical protein
MVQIHFGGGHRVYAIAVSYDFTGGDFYRLAIFADVQLCGDASGGRQVKWL